MAKNQLSHDFVPNLTGRCDPIVEQAIRDLYLRFYKFNPVQNITQQVSGPLVPQELTGNIGVSSAYTITFTKDGTVTSAEMSPSFTVNKLRDGFKPIIMSLTADGAPSTGDLTVNFQLMGVDMLASPLTLPNGQVGPVTTTLFALPDSIPALQKIRMKIVNGGDAFQVVGEIVMGKTAHIAVKVK